MTRLDYAAPPPRSSAWLFFTMLAIAMWGVWGIISRLAEKELSAAAVTVISTVGVVPAGLVLLASPRVWRGKGFFAGGLAAFCTGLCGSVGNVAMLLSFKHGGEASTVLPLTSMFPLVTLVLAVLLLRERVNRIQIVGIVVALAAIYLFNPPADATATAPWWQKMVTRWMAYAFVAMFLWGVAAVLQKVATNRISTELATVLFVLAFIPVAGVLWWMSRQGIIDPISWKISGRAWMLAILYGALIGLGTLVLFAAYRDGKASIVTALYALYPAITVLLAVPILREKIGPRTGVAIALALVAGVMLSYERPAKATETGVG
jgi:uncharacterized membrane protein